MAEEANNHAEEAGLHGDEAEMMARLQDEISRLPVSEHLVYMLHSLSSLAAVRLGLTPESEGKADPPQARLAIDAFKALVGVLEQVRSTHEMAVHRGMLAQLQFAYASIVAAPRPGVVTEDAGATASPAAAAAATPAVVDEAAPEAAADEVTPPSAVPAPEGTPEAAPKPRKPRKPRSPDSGQE